MDSIFSRKPRIAVCGVSGLPGGNELAGRLGASLRSSGRYHVIEHPWKATSHPAHAAHLGRQAGAHVVIIGHVLQSVPGKQGSVDLAGTVRALAAATGETLAVAEARASAMDQLGEALASRIERLLRGVRNPIRASPRRIRILSAYGGMIVLEAGSLHGLETGTRLEVRRVLEAVPDPCHRAAVRMLGHLTVKIGEADVLEVAERFAVAAYRGAQNPRAGDFARDRIEPFLAIHR
ncbi:MAG: hypothetical protein ACLP59_05455 [Bryobacteraceae bacterium]